MRPITIVYIVFTYVVLQFTWWGYHIYTLNGEIDRLEFQVEQLENPDFLPSREQEEEKLKRRQIMIIGEGSVFLLLLSLGAWRIHKSYLKEVKLGMQQRNFLLAVTHELKSPLASIKLNLQTINRPNLDESNAAKLRGNALKDVNRLNGLVDNILLASKLENKYYKYQKGLVPLGTLIIEMITHLERNLSKNITIEQHIDESIKFKGDEHSLYFVFSNLIDNALKYSNSDSTVSIYLEKNTKFIKFMVKDQGVGVPDADKKNIFKKFYRVGNEHTRSSKGTGLGLYIVSEVLKNHEGKIKVLDNTPKGSIFEVSLPLV